jgi:Fic family protein
MIYEDVVEFWRAQDVRTEAALEQILDNFRVLFAFHSAKIENDRVDYHDTREIFCNGQVSGYTGDLRTLFEQQNQRICYYFLLDKIVARRSIDVGLIKEIHAALTAGTYDERTYIANDERPGTFKKHDYVVGLSEVGYPPQDVETGLAELIDEIRFAKSRDILSAAAYFHAKFEYIHPFADGNGRTGRTLLNYYLLTQNHPPLVIFSDEKTKYSIALEAYDQTESIDPLKKVIRDSLVRTWQGKIERSQ